jgi:hypothetical protein
VRPPRACSRTHPWLKGAVARSADLWVDGAVPGAKPADVWVEIPYDLGAVRGNAMFADVQLAGVRVAGQAFRERGCPWCCAAC